jgi:hypothetical protein
MGSVWRRKGCKSEEQISNKNTLQVLQIPVVSEEKRWIRVLIQDHPFVKFLSVSSQL